ncbi:lysozyme [uncultured Ruegeria sp.]|uniref:lysozyme n=1 Tax=uncultured Ruegeria sp. TaxID=259304 RepID=UPI00262BDB35|nr:lysozyme [uncultured Ruegeria sp.]
MKLIPNWKSVAQKAHSMWAYYASLICLILPEIIFWHFDIDTHPRIWWVLGVALLIYGIIGRLWDQGIDRTKMRSPWIVGIMALGLVAVLAMQHGTSFTNAVIGTNSTPGVTAEHSTTPSAPAATASTDATFLEIAVPFVGRWEGLRLEAYLDIVGVPTVCYGETKGVELGDTHTKAECDAMLAREVIAYRDALRPAFSAETLLYRMPVTRDVAFSSLAYNVGVSRTSKSTAVQRLNEGSIAGACTALGWWSKAGGRVVRGLVNRRSEETELCMRGVA